MIRIVRHIGAGVVASLLTIAVGASPASASPSLSPSLLVPASCPSTNLCVYVDSGYSTSGGYELFPVQNVGVCETVDPFRNALSSAWNFAGRNVRFYKNTACTGTDYKTLNNGTGNPQFSTHWDPTWENSVDAIRWS